MWSGYLFSVPMIMTFVIPGGSGSDSSTTGSFFDFFLLFFGLTVCKPKLEKPKRESSENIMDHFKDSSDFHESGETSIEDLPPSYSALSSQGVDETSTKEFSTELPIVKSMMLYYFSKIS